MSEERHAQLIRYRRDFYSNPVFGELMEALVDQQRKELISLKGASKGQDLSQVNFHAGVVEGIERQLALIENMRQEGMNKNGP